MNKKYLTLKLFEIGAVKFGNYQLKSGQNSPIYLDLRLIISFPELLTEVAKAIWEQVKHLQFDLICGVPYTALPIATAISLQHRIPMVMRRKEIKKHGTGKLIEGYFHQGQTCLIIEDLITTGSSILETIAPLTQESLKIRDIAILIDREQGGRQVIEEKGYHLHTVLNLREMLHILQAEGKIDQPTVDSTLEFLKKISVAPPKTFVSPKDM